MNDMISSGTAPEIRMIARVQVAPWAEQPRRNFDAAKLEELAASMRAHGFLASSPLLVRSRKRLLAIPDADFEIIAGERRWRAAEQVGIEFVPCVVSEMTDAQALEIALVENLQRDDLSPMEEAEGYAQLLEMRDEEGDPLYCVAGLATKVGRSEQHLFRRIGLRRLRGSIAQEALADGRISISHAELLSTLATTSLQDEVCGKILKPAYEPGPLSYRKAEQLIRDEYQRGLKSAKFDPTAESLVPLTYDEEEVRTAGGACGDCPHNTKNSPAEEKAGREHLCRNPECFRAKEEAEWEVWRALMAETNPDAQTLPDEDNAALWDHTGRTVGYQSGLVEVDSQPPVWEIANGINVASVPSYRAIAEQGGVSIILAKDKSGKVHELVKRDLAITASRSLHPEMFKAPAVRKNDDQREAEGKERARLMEEKKRVLIAQEREIIQAVLRKGTGDEVFFNLIFSGVLNFTEVDEIAAEKGWEADADDERDDMVQACAFMEEHFAPLPLPQKHALLAQAVIRTTSEYGTERSQILAPWAQAYDVKLAAVEARVREDLLEEAKAKAREESAEKAAQEGQTWVTRKEEVEDFDWDEHGICANPDLCELSFGKKDKTVANVKVARGVKGWYVALRGELPMSTSATYSDRALAFRSGLIELHQYFLANGGNEKTIAKLAGWLGKDEGATGTVPFSHRAAPKIVLADETSQIVSVTQSETPLLVMDWDVPQESFRWGPDNMCPEPLRWDLTLPQICGDLHVAILTAQHAGKWYAGCECVDEIAGYLMLPSQADLSFGSAFSAALSALEGLKTVLTEYAYDDGKYDVAIAFIADLIIRGKAQERAMVTPPIASNGKAQKEALKPWAQEYSVELVAVEMSVREEMAEEAKAKAREESSEKATQEGLKWVSRKEAIEDFVWNEHGICTNPDVCELSFGKKDKTVASVKVARGTKGWHVTFGAGNVGPEHRGRAAFPSQKLTAYSDRELAFQTGLLEVREFLLSRGADKKAVAKVNGWLGMNEEDPVRAVIAEAPAHPAPVAQEVVVTEDIDAAEIDSPKFVWHQEWLSDEQAKHSEGWLDECLSMAECELFFPFKSSLTVSIFVAERKEGWLFGLQVHSAGLELHSEVVSELPDETNRFYCKTRWAAMDMALLALEDVLNSADNIDASAYDRLAQYMELVAAECEKEKESIPAPAKAKKAVKKGAK